jgi:hypothetical protein
MEKAGKERGKRKTVRMEKELREVNEGTMVDLTVKLLL